MDSKRALLQTLVGTDIVVNDDVVLFPGSGYDYAYTLKDLDGDMMHLVAVTNVPSAPEKWIAIDSITQIVRIK